MFECFKDRDTWDIWRHHVGPRAYPCQDCTPEFKEKNLATGTCQHPETVFGVDSDGFISGVCAAMPLYRYQVVRGNVSQDTMEELLLTPTTLPSVATAIERVLGIVDPVEVVQPVEVAA